MKKILMMLALCAAVCLPSCSDDKDEPNTGALNCTVSLSVKVVNQDGKNLLDPKVEGNILGENMTLSIDGATVNVATVAPTAVVTPAPAHAFASMWYGAYVSRTDVKQAGDKIVIGQFVGTGVYSQEMTLNLGGESFKLSYDNNYRSMENCTREFYLNGQLIEKNLFPLERGCTYTVTLNR